MNKQLNGFFSALLLTVSNVHAAETTRVSVNSAGEQGNGPSAATAISADGRIVAFWSYADNLVANDTNMASDAFVHDRRSGKTTRINVNSAGKQANAHSFSPTISADGRFVAFDSFADNLVAGDTNNSLDAFVHDRVSGETTRVSVNSAGEQGNGSSFVTDISADGGLVLLVSAATNLVAGDTNGLQDAFVRNLATGQTMRVSVSSTGEEANGVNYPRGFSADGRFIAFGSDADNLVVDDSNGVMDAFIHDRKTGETTRISVNSAGRQANAASYVKNISADGRFVTFDSYADNLVAGDTNNSLDAFVHDRVSGETTRVSVNSAGEPGNAATGASGISADGRFVLLVSAATNLVAGDSNGVVDDFVHDRKTGQTKRISRSTAGKQGNRMSDIGAISADGRFATFGSEANNLVTGDTNHDGDAFVRDRRLNNTQTADVQIAAVSQPAALQKGEIASYRLKITNNGPDTAGGVAVTNIVSQGRMTAIVPSQGTCSKAAVSVCHLGALVKGASATLSINIKATGNPLKQQISVNAAPNDDALHNNALIVNTTVTP